MLSPIADSGSHAPSGAPAPQRLRDGYGLAFTVGASITVTAALVALGFLRARPVVQRTTVAKGRKAREATPEPETMAA